MMDRELYYNINNLLSHLRAANAITLINAYYHQWNNDAPGIVTQNAMNRLQVELDAFNAEEQAMFKEGNNNA